MEGQEVYNVTWEHINNRVALFKSMHGEAKVYGIPRGGQVIAGILGNAVETPEEADIIVDDIYDSGATAAKWLEKYPNKMLWVMVNKKHEPKFTDVWIKFPWESESQADMDDHISRLLQINNIKVTKYRLKEINKFIQGLKTIWSD